NPDLADNDYRYLVIIRAQSANKKFNTKYSDLHLTIVIQNQLNRIKRETNINKNENKEDKALLTTNSEPIPRQITNFQTTFNLRILSGDTNSLTIGKVVQYKLDISLPRTSGLDLLLEIYTKDIINDTYYPALSLFNVSVSNKVAGIGFISTGGPPKPKMFFNSINNNVYDKITLDFGTVANNGAEGNKLSIFFSAALVRKTNLITGSKHFVTVGAEYNQGSYVWVGVSQVIAETISASEDNQLAEVDLKGAQPLALDSALTLTVDALMEFRSDEILLEMWGPSHPYEPNNVIAMGHIAINEFGSNYQSVPNNPQHYQSKRIESQSQLSYQKTVLNMGLITNIGEKVGKASTDANNRIVYSMTIYAINDNTNVGKTVPLNLQLTIGNNTVWKHSVNIKIIDRKHEKSIARMLASNANYYPLMAFQGSLTTLNLYTEFSESQTFIDFSVVVEVPTARKLALLEPCSARLVKEETGINIPYVSSQQLEPTVEGNQYTFNFGRIQQIKQRLTSKSEDNTLVTEIVLKIAFHEENIEGKILSANVKVISGSKSIKVKTENIQIITDKKSMIPSLSINKAVPWNYLFIDGGAMSVNINMLLPNSVAYEEVKLEVHGNNETTIALPEINICRLEVTRVGPSIPCSCVAKPKINKNKVFYERHSNKNTTDYDYSSITLGDIAVLQKPSLELDRNFNLNFVATILDGTVFESGVMYPFYVGLSIGTDLIWSSNVTFPMKSDTTMDMTTDIKPKLFSYLKNTLPVNPGFTTEAIIKLETPIHTVTNYTIELMALDKEVSICGLWISNIGRNMPCLSSDLKASYEMRRIGENNRAIINFKNVANVGPNYQISPEEEKQANTIELMAMVRIKGSANNNKFVDIIVKYGENQMSVNSKLEVPVVKELSKINNEFKAPKVFTFDMFNGSRTVGIGSSALLTFDIELEPNSQVPIRTQLAKHNDFQICDASVIEIGSNYPCFSPFDLKKSGSIFDLGMICNTYLNKEDKTQNKVRLGIAVRFADDLKTDQTIKLIGDGFAGNTSIANKKQNIDLVVKRDIEQTIGDFIEPRIAPKNATPFPAKIREKVWIAFNLTIPPKSIVKVAVEVKGAVEENRAIITLHGLRIASGGPNIPCPMANANPTVKYDSSIGNNQHDTITANLGYLSNFGFSHAFGSHVAGDDDITIEVLAQFTDHLMTDENSSHTIKITAILGDESNAKRISGAKYMRVVRTHTERPIIETEILINNITTYDRNHMIDAMAVIRHSDKSTGEPANPALRLFLPPFIKFGQIVSHNTRDDPIVKNQSNGATVDIVMPWILFPDIFTINFTFIVDPENQRGYGKNETFVSVPYRVICEHFRVSVSSKFPCSRVNDFTFRAKSSECDKALGMASGLIKDCQLSASSAVSANYAPHFGRQNSGNFWAPALRYWSQKQYLQMDFLKNTRVTKIAVQSVRNNRKVMSYSLMASDNNKVWFNVNNISYLSYADGVAYDVIQKPQEARYFRFVIEEASDPDRENDQLVAVKLEFFGCYLDDNDLSNNTCSSEATNTWFSDNNNGLSRHFSADPYTNVLYFCDSTSDMNQQICYYSNSGGNTWHIIGRSIDTIVGYELTTGKTFGTDSRRGAYLSTKDGIKWTPESYETFNQTVFDHKFQHKTVVPGLHREGIRRMNLKTGNWKALQDGLYFDDSNVPKAYWNRCCNV
ncbi:uncharacterized protein LOC128957912, partial [Oppia nitens]|uniref:uncharacterized protein LOC128957912 n=1 Tax=Oppia nitens TaxID=1686743 RepID=UPI0023DAD972